MDLNIFFIHSAIYCTLFTAAIVVIGLVNPRMMLQDFPPEIIKAVPPKSDKEKTQGIVFGIAIVVMFIGYPLIVGWIYLEGHSSFIEIFKVVWGLMFVVNLFDLLIIDWLILCMITPTFFVLKGTEGNPGYKNYKFHFIGFLKGLMITAVLAALGSAVIYFVQ